MYKMSKSKVLAMLVCLSFVLMTGTLIFCAGVQNVGGNINVTYIAPKGFLTYALNSTQNGWVVTGYDESKRNGKTTIEIPERWSQNGKDLPVTEIKASTFSNNSVFTSLILNKNLLVIGSSAFNNSKVVEVYYPGSLKEWCESSTSGLNNLLSSSRNLYVDNKKIEGRLTITDDITKINDYAFYDLDELTGISIGSGVNGVGYRAFSNSKDTINNIFVDKSNANYTSRASDNNTECNVIIDKTTKTLIQGCKNSTFPNNSGVTKIGDYAFWHCAGLTGNLSIPNSVIDIGQYSFRYCSGLTSLTLGSNLESIGEIAFESCVGLTGTLTLPNKIKKIGVGIIQGTKITQINYLGTLKEWCEQIEFSIGSLFDYSTDIELYINGSKITELTITSDITKISNYAFYNYKGLIRLTLGSMLKTIGRCAFENTAITGNLTIPNSVTEMLYGAFMECKGLTKVTIGTGLTTLSEFLFSHSGLTSVTIPKNITSIGYYAFGSCNNLMESFIESSEIYKVLRRNSTDGLTNNTGSKTYVLTTIDDGTNSDLTNTRYFTKSAATINRKYYNVYTRI